MTQRSLTVRLRSGLLLALLTGLGALAGVMADAAPAAAVAPTAVAAVPCAATTVNGRAATLAVVVTFGSGATRTRCTTPGGSGIEVLRRAGFAPTTQSYGSVGGGDTAVCSLTDPDNGTVEGCDSGPRCLTCLQPDSWGYFPGYRYSQIGAGDTRPGAGTVEAWRWGRSSSWPGAKPRATEICVPEQPPTTPSTTNPTVPPGGGGTANPRPPGGSANPVNPGNPENPDRPDGGGPSGPGWEDGSGSGPGQADGDPGPSTSDDPDAPVGTDAPSSSSSVPGSDAEAPAESTEPGDSADEGAGAEPDDSEGRARADEVEGESALEVTPAGQSGPSGSSRGSPWKPLLITSLVVGVLAAFAVRARRGRAPATDT